MAVVDLVAMQQVDANPGVLDIFGNDPVDQIALPAGARPFWIEIDAINKYAYVTDENTYGGAVFPKGRIYVIDIDPASPNFHRADKVVTIEVDSAGKGLRQLAISNDGRRLYVAAPNRDGSSPIRTPAQGGTDFAESRLVVVNIDRADRPTGPGLDLSDPATFLDPSKNPRQYWRQINTGIKEIKTGQETYAIQTTDDNHRILFTNRWLDAEGLGILTVTDDSIDNFGTTIQTVGLTLGASNDTFDVNNGISIVILPEDALKASIGAHPEYIFVGGYNRFIQGDPSHDPDAFLNGSGFGVPPPGGSNIGIIRGGELVGATLPIPLGSIDNLAFASGYNYLFAGYRGVAVEGAGDGAVFAFNLVNLIKQVEVSKQKDDALPPEQQQFRRLPRFPVDRMYLNEVLPMQEDLNGFNTGIDIKADYRVIRYSSTSGRILFGVPYVMDGQGHYLDAEGNVLPYTRDGNGVFRDLSGQPVPASALLAVPSPNRPFATGGAPQGLSAHPTETAPAPLVWNQWFPGRGIGLDDRDDFGIKDLINELTRTQDCPPGAFGSTVQLDTGAVVETHALAAYQSLGQTQQLTLSYNSTSADVMPIVTFSFPIEQAKIQAYLATAPASELSASGHALLEASITFTGAGGTHTTPVNYWRIPAPSGQPGNYYATVGLQADLSALPGGYYTYVINSKLLGKTSTETGALLVDNKTDSVFGRGWSLNGLQELYRGVDGSLQINNAAGEVSSFDKLPGPVFSLLTTDYPGATELYKARSPSKEAVMPELLQKLASGQFQRVAPDGTAYLYDAPTVSSSGQPVAGKLRLVTDRYGNKTEYGYNGAGHIEFIKDPAGLVTKFEYSGDRVSRIINPDGVVTGLAYLGKDLQTITDADLSSRTFGYDPKGRMTTEINKLGQIEQDFYDPENGRATLAIRSDLSQVSVQAWQTVALKPQAETASRAAPAFASTLRMQDIRATYTAVDGTVVKATLDESGRTVAEHEVDSTGAESEHGILSRDEIGSVVKYTNEEGYTTYSIYDERGNKIRFWDDESGVDPATGLQRATVLTYDPVFNRLASITDELGNKTTYVIDNKGNVAQRINADGGIWIYTYFPQGLLKTELDPLGHLTKYEYDARGRIQTLTNPDGTTRTFEYAADTDPANPNGQIQTSTDELGRVTVSTFDAMNRAIRVAQSEVEYLGTLVKPERHFTYDASGRPETVTDAEGNVSTTEYDDQGRLRKQIDDDGKVTEYHYNDLGQLDWMQDALLNKTEYFYDEDGRLETEVDAAGGKTHYEYHFIAPDGSERHSARPTEIVTDFQGPNQATTEYSHDARGRLVLRTNDDGSTYRWSYDGANNLVSTIDERGTETRYEYDSMNRRTLVIEDFGPGRSNFATRTYYDVLGNVLAVTDARQAIKLSDQDLKQWLTTHVDAPPFTTVFRYDALTNRKVSMTDAMDNTTTYSYDAVGNLTDIIAPGNRVTHYTYDALNRVTSVTFPDPEGNSSGPQSVTRLEYDRVGNVLLEVDALGNETTYEYDGLNRRTAVVNAKLERTETHYDAVGNVEYTLDALGRKTSFFYDELNRQIEVRGPNPVGSGPQVTLLERHYDTAGNLAWEKDARGHTTEYIEYDAMGRLLKVQDARGGVTEYRYDGLGNRTEVIDALGNSTFYEYDRLNRLTRVTGPEPGAIDLAPAETVVPGADPQHEAPEVSYAYDEVGNLVQTTDARQGITKSTYDANNRRTSFTSPDPDGGGALQAAVTRYFHDEVGNLVRMVDARDQETVYEYDKQDQLIRETTPDPDGAAGTSSAAVTRYFYDEAGNLVRTVDPLQRESRIDYDELNRAIAFWTQDIDRPARTHYDAAGRVNWSEDEEGRRTSFGYDALDRRVSVTSPDPDGPAGSLAAPAQHFSYDLNGNLLSSTNARNNVETYTYDELGRRETAVDASGRKTVNEYDAVGNLVRQSLLGAGATLPTVQVTIQYDALQRAVKTTTTYRDAPGGTAQQVSTYTRYDTHGNVVRRIDELGRLTASAYDALDRLLSVTTPDPDGAAGTMQAATVHRAYDAMGNVVAETDALGHVTNYDYDFMGRLVRVVEPATGGSTPEVRYAYDAVGNLAAVTDEEQNTTRYEYDARNQVTLIIDALGGRTVMRYDRVGNVVARVDALGDETRMEYDALDRLVRIIGPDPDGAGAQASAVTVRSYDPNGNLVRLVDTLGNPTQYAYDKLDRLIEVIDAKGSTSSRVYDENGFLAQATDFRGNATRFEYDGLGRQVAAIDAAGNTTRQRYDAAGNLVWQQDALLREKTFEYDNLDRLVTVRAPDPDVGGPLGPTIVRSEYDAKGNLTATVDPRGFRTLYEYDVRDRLIRVVDAENQAVEMTYDGSGRMLSRTVGGTQSTQYRYDALGRLIAEIDADGKSALAAFDAVGNVVSTTDRRGFVTTREYDHAGRLVKLWEPAPEGSTDPADRPLTQFSYDAFGNLLSVLDARLHLTAYAYDELNRRTKVTDALGNASNTFYDANGNVVAVQDARGNVTLYAYDKLNRVTGIEDALTRKQIVEYDAVGNVARKIDAKQRETTFDYDALNRLVRVNLPDPDTTDAVAAPQLSYAYDAAGNRVAETDANQNTTRHSYDGIGRRTSTTDALNNTTRVEYDEFGNVLRTLDEKSRATVFEYDTLNRLVKVSQPNPDPTAQAAAPTLLYAYDEMGNLLSSTDPLNHTTRYEYDSLNRRSRIVDALGNEISMAYDRVGNLVSSTDARLHTTTFAYDELNRLVRKTLPDPDGTGLMASPVISYSYDEAGNLEKVVDARSNVTTHAYDALNRRIATEDADGNVRSMTLDEVGNVTASFDELGRATRFSYDGLNRLVRQESPDPDGTGTSQTLLPSVTTFGYDAGGNLQSVTDAKGVTTRYGYDVLNRRTTTVEDFGGSLQRTTSVGYDEVGDMVFALDANLNRTVYRYDALHRLVEVEDALEQTMRSEYDLAGNITRAVDATGRKTDFAYDSLNRLIKSIDNANKETAWTYDAVGNLLSETDRLGRTKSYAYDNLDRRILVTLPDPDGNGAQVSSTLAYAYDASGNLTSARDERGFVTRYEYDKLDRQVRMIDPLNGISVIEYDAVGNRIAVTDPLNQRTRFAYDNLDRLVASAVPDPAGSTDIGRALITAYAYDEVGNRVKTTDPLGHATSVEYDALNRRIAETDANLKTTRYEYTAKSEMSAVVDPAGNRTEYEYDVVSRLLRQSDPLGERSFAYDAAGRLTRAEDALGRVTTRTYDALGRNDGETWLDAAGTAVRTITRSFDAEGQLLSTSDLDATYTMAYDGLGRMTSIDNAGTPGLPHVVLSYAYDAAGNVTRVASSINGATDWRTDYEYDALGRTTSMSQSGGSAVAKRAEYGYDAANQLNAIRRFDVENSAAAATTSMTYDSAGRMTGLIHAQSGTELARYAYAWDAASRLVGVSSSDGDAAFAYDAQGQLVASDYANQSGNPTDQGYTWDANGNPLRPGVTLGSANRVLEDEAATYAYDAEGNRATRTDKATGVTTTYSWDHRNRLVGATDEDSSGTVIAQRSFRYDDFGWKIAATVDGDGSGPGTASTSVYVHDRDDIAMMLTPEGAVSELFLHGPGMDGILAEQHGDVFYWTLTDHQNSVRDVVSSAGTVMNHIVYDSFGRIVSQTDASVALRFSYTGRELDAGLRMMDYRARWYDQALGRFISRDSIGFVAGDANLYRYVQNRPMDRVDPTGHESQSMQAVKSVLEFEANVAQTVWETASETVVALTVGATYAVGETVTGLVDLAWGIGEAAIFATKALASGTAYLQYLATGDKAYRQISNDLYNETIGKLQKVLDDPCAGPLEKMMRMQKVVAPAKGLTERFEEYGRTQVRAHLPPRLQKAFDVGTKAGVFVSFFLEPQTILVALAGKTGKAAKALHAMDVASDASRIEKMQDDIQKGLRTAAEVRMAEGKPLTKGMEQAMSAGRGAESLNAASRGTQAVKAADNVIDAQRSANALQRTEVAAAATSRADAAVAAMQAERAQKATQREKASEALGDFFKEMREKGFATKTEAMLEKTGGIMPPYAGTASIIANASKAPQTLFERAVSSVKQGLLERFGAHTGATARQQQIIEAFAKEQGLDIAVRASDVVTANVTRLGTHLGLAAKGESTKAKSIFGLLYDKGLKRSDLDLAFVYDRTAGRMLTNSEVLSRVVDPLNARLIAAGDKSASFMHGSHLTMEAIQGGYTSNAMAARIGNAGASTVFGRGTQITMAASDVADIGQANRLARIEVLNNSGAAAKLSSELEAVSRTPVKGALPPEIFEQQMKQLGPRQFAANQMKLHMTGGSPIFYPDQQLAPMLQQWDQLALPAFHQSVQGIACNPTAAAALIDLTRIEKAPSAREFDEILRGLTYFMDGTKDADVLTAFKNKGITYLRSTEADNLSDLVDKLRVTTAAGMPVGFGVQFPNNGAMSAHALVALGFESISNVEYLRYFDPAGARIVRKPLQEFLNQGTNTARILEDVMVAYPQGMISGGFLLGNVPSQDASYGNHELEEIGSVLELARFAQGAWASLSLEEMPLLWISIADLPAGELGLAYITQLDAEGRPSEARIVLDKDADGHGWFIDRTPLDAGEFSDPTSGAFGRYDLFSVLAHEIGHTLGFLSGYDGFDEHVVQAADGSLSFQSAKVRVSLSADGNHLADSVHASDLMSDSLATFERKLPSELAAQIVLAARNAAEAGPAREVLIGGAALDASPGGVVNGLFDEAAPGAAGFGWQAGGAASVENGQGVLSESPTLASRFAQALVMPTGARALMFTLVDADFDAVTGGPQDAFEVALLDTQSMQSLLGDIGLANTDALFNLQADGTVYRAQNVQLSKADGTPVSSATGPVNVRIGLDALNDGQAMTLYFDLLGFGALGSRVVIDDVRFLFEGENQAPVAVADSAETAEDAPLTFDPRANDSDPEGSPLSVQLTSGAAHGSLVVLADGRVTYTPDANYFGSDSFSYRVSDGIAVSAPVQVSLNVTPVNDAPVGTPDAYMVDEDTPLTVAGPGVLANDVDVDGDALSAVLVTGPQHGSLALNPDGGFTYTPAANYFGPDSFSYQASDGAPEASVAVVSISVNAVNDGPVGVEDALSALEDSPAIYTAAQLLGNDTDADGDPLTLASVTSGANGTAVLNADGTVRFTPDANFNGLASFAYTVTDGGLTSDPTTVRVAVAPLNDTPVAADDSYVVNEDTELRILAALGVLANDTDVDGDALAAVLVAGPQHGSLTLNADGSFTYTPAANFFGSDSFTYRAGDGTGQLSAATVAIEVTAVNDAPLAADDSFSTDEDTILVVAAPGVLANDTDVDGDALTASLVSAPAHGSLTLNPDGAFTYTPDPDYHGTDSFTYRSSDASLGSNTATVSITVNPVNDAPIARDDAAGALEDGAAIVIDVLANDTDVDAGDTRAVVALDTSTTAGTVSLEAGGLSVRYAAGGAFQRLRTGETATDRFGYTIEDSGGARSSATVTVTITGVNDAPLARIDAYGIDEDAILTIAGPGVLGNDEDAEGDTLFALLVDEPAHGSLSFNADGAFTYTPDPDFNGSDSFRYRASDASLESEPATVSITVRPVNDAPVARDDAAHALEDGAAIAIDVLANDMDVDAGDTRTVSVIDTTGTAGTVTIDADGAGVHYAIGAAFQNLLAGEIATDTFTYTMTDASGAASSASVTVTVTGVNDAPVAHADAGSTDEDHAVTIDVLANDADADAGDTRTLVSVTGGAAGATVSLVGNHLFYDPGSAFQSLKAGALASDTLTYTMQDSAGAQSTATVTVSITGVNDAPQFITTPVTSLAIEAPRSRANLDSVFQAAGPQGSAVRVRFELPNCGEAQEMGLYRVDDLYGTVRGIAAGGSGYAAAALAPDRAQVAFSIGDKKTSKELTLVGGALYAFYIVPGEENDHNRRSDCNARTVLFSIAEANADGQDHMQATLGVQGRLTIKWDESGDDGHEYSGYGYGHEQHKGNGYGHDDDHASTVVRATGFVVPVQANAYVYDAEATDIDGDTLAYRLLEAPAGASIDAASGLVNWTPQAAGQYRFVIRVEDGQGGSAEQAYNLEVTRKQRLLEVRGTDCNDQIEVFEDQGGILRVTINGATRYYSGITAIHVDARGGNDQVRLEGLTMATLVEGGAGNDKLDGSAVRVARLELRGDAGNDDLRGGADADYLVGGEGNDVLRGGCGADWILGGAGKDVLFGDEGNDVLAGGEGDDVLKGGGGNDILASGPGRDNLDGGGGCDRTVDGAALAAGTVSGVPPPPTPMLDWLRVGSVETITANGTRHGKSADSPPGPIDWECKPGLRSACGLNPFERVKGLAAFAQPWDTQEAPRQAKSQEQPDRPKTLTGWKNLD